MGFLAPGLWGGGQDGASGPRGLIFWPPLTSRLQSKAEALTKGVKGVFVRLGTSRSKQLCCLSAVTRTSFEAISEPRGKAPLADRTAVCCKTCPELPACFSNRFGNSGLSPQSSKQMATGLGQSLANAALKLPFPSLLTPADERLPFWSCFPACFLPRAGRCLPKTSREGGSLSGAAEALPRQSSPRSGRPTPPSRASTRARRCHSIGRRPGPLASGGTNQ